MPRYKVIVECSGPHGNAALTYRINAASQFAAEFRAKNRAKTFPGIAKAMAEQWGKL